MLGTTSLTASVTIDLPSLFVRDNMLYAVNKAADPRNVVAFDLTTGEQVWTEKRNVGEAKIIRVDESGVWAMETTSSEGSLVVIDHKSGETSVRKKGVLSMAWSSMRSSFVYEHQGTLVVTTRSRQVPDLLPRWWSLAEPRLRPARRRAPSVGRPATLGSAACHARPVTPRPGASGRRTVAPS